MKHQWTGIPQFVTASTSAPSDVSQPYHALLSALQQWETGAAPADVVRAAATCTPRDATEAILRVHAERLRKYVVLDVGANKGYPVTRLSLQYGVGVLVSVEPDLRNFGPLSGLENGKGSRFLAVRGAVSEKKGVMKMAFHKERDDFTCFNCLNVSREEVSVEKVNVSTVDGLVYEKAGGSEIDSGMGILLLKTDTQGHEASVLRGAKRLLGSGRVLFVIMEFDPKLFQKKENAMNAMKTLFDAGMHCVHLTFAMVDAEDRKKGLEPRFGESVGKDNAEGFYEFVKKTEKYTDLLCAKKGS